MGSIGPDVSFQPALSSCPTIICVICIMTACNQSLALALFLQHLRREYMDQAALTEIQYPLASHENTSVSSKTYLVPYLGIVGHQK